MKSFITRLRRFSRLTVISLCLLILALSVAMAEGWGNVVSKPKFPALSVTASEVVYTDGSTLTSDGTYTTGGVAYSESAVMYDLYGNEYYPDGTTLYANGTWTSPNN